MSEQADRERNQARAMFEVGQNQVCEPHEQEEQDQIPATFVVRMTGTDSLDAVTFMCAVCAAEFIEQTAEFNEPADQFEFTLIRVEKALLGDNE